MTSTGANCIFPTPIWELPKPSSTLPYGVRYDLHEDPWVSGSKVPGWRIEKDTDYLDEARLYLHQRVLPPHRPDLSLRDEEIKFEKAVYSATKREELPEPLPPPYAWAQSNPTLLCCPLPENYIWPRVSRGGTHVMLMLRAAWEYETCSEAWDDGTKKDFIRRLWNMHPGGPLLNNPYFQDFNGVADIHLLRVMYGPIEVSRHKVFFWKKCKDIGILPPDILHDKREFGANITSIRKRTAFLKKKHTSLRFRQRCDRTVWMLGNHPQTWLSNKQDYMEIAGGSDKEAALLNWTPLSTPIVGTHCEWPLPTTDGVSERDLQLALGVYNRWSLSWPRKDQAHFIQLFCFMKKNRQNKDLVMEYLETHWGDFTYCCVIYAMCLTWGDRVVSRYPGFQAYLSKKYHWHGPYLLSAPLARIERLHSVTGINKEQLTRGLPSFGTYLPILGLTMCPRVQGGVPQPGEHWDPLPTHSEIGWRGKLPTVKPSAKTQTYQNEGSRARHSAPFSLSEENPRPVYPNVEGDSETKVSNGEDPSGKHPSTLSLGDRASADKITFASIFDSLAAAHAIRERPSSQATLSTRAKEKRSVTDESLPDQPSLKTPRLEEQVIKTCSQIQTVIEKRDDQIIPEVEGMMSESEKPPELTQHAVGSYDEANLALQSRMRIAEDVNMELSMRMQVTEAENESLRRQLQTVEKANES